LLITLRDVRFISIENSKLLFSGSPQEPEAYVADQTKSVSQTGKIQLIGAGTVDARSQAKV